MIPRVKRSRLALVLMALAMTTGSLAIWRAVDNPEIHTMSMGQWQCLAPYDSVLSGRSTPGGEHQEDVTTPCRAATRGRFAQAALLGVVATGLGLTSIVWRRRPAGHRPPEANEQ